MANKLTCIVTGRTLLATDDYYKRKVEKAGSEEDLHRTYICREAKNMIKQGTSINRVREVLEVDEQYHNDVPQDVIDQVLATNTKTNFRRINNIMTVNSMLNTTTDPEVREYIDRLKQSK
jgi:hypothetical protein